MSMFDEQVYKAEVDYRREQGRGRLSAWARAEGRSGERLMRRPKRRGNRIRSAA